METIDLSDVEFSLENVVLIEFLDDSETASFKARGLGNDLLQKVFLNEELAQFYAVLMRDQGAPINFWDEYISDSIKESLEKVGIFHGLTIRRIYKGKNIFFSFGLKNKIDFAANFYLNFLDRYTFEDPEHFENILEKFEELTGELKPIYAGGVH